LQGGNEPLTSAITEKISIRQLIKTLNFSRQLGHIEKLFRKKVQCSHQNQLMSRHCKDNLRKKRRKTQVARRMSREKVESVCA
jgi:hypothetical protein